MNWFRVWLFKWILNKEIRQGYDQHKKIEQLYKLIREESKREFFEDSDLTIDEYLRERFEATQCEPYMRGR